MAVFIIVNVITFKLLRLFDQLFFTSHLLQDTRIFVFMNEGFMKFLEVKYFTFFFKFPNSNGILVTCTFFSSVASNNFT